ncbi:MAG: ubiquinone/menaquinone biosynthesis C-methylase UbiE [Gammaproteobacteria bacterium]|jgi:ubiquinone/menaquinone biosynthesis C-methylase UbiE
MPGHHTDDPPATEGLEYGLSIPIERLEAEWVILGELLDLDKRDILELGCGRAEKTRAIASSGSGRSILALEVDEEQHALNRQITDLPNVRFALGAAEAIPAEHNSFDVVLLFKSLHHVPVDSMDRALAEVVRVLRPGGLAYISEPIFRGDFNQVLRIFHDESRVRGEAFAAIKRLVVAGTVELVSQTFFRDPLTFQDCAEFERLVIGVTHTKHVLSTGKLRQVRAQFASFAGTGATHFEQPIRVDLLRLPPET